MRAPGGLSPLHSVSAVAFSPWKDLVKNYRVRPTHWLIYPQVRLLLEAGADPSKPEVLHPMAVKMRRMTWVGKTLFGDVQARGYHKLFSTLPANFKQSPTHIAAQQGDLAKIKVLAEHEKFPVAQYKDTKGRTPVALCVEDTVKTAVAELVGPAAMATPIPGNKVAPEQ